MGFRQHHFIGGHVLFALGHVFQIQTNPQFALVAHFNRRTGQTCRAHVLDRDHRAGFHQFQTGLHQAFFGERVTDLNGGALFLNRVVEFRRRHGRAANTVAAGFRTQIHNRHADARRRRIENLVCIGQTCGERVHQTVAVIGGVEPHLTADGRNAETVPVTANALNHAVDQLTGLGVVFFTEGQRVHRGNRARAHGEHVAQNAANPGRRALIGFDIGRVVVALHLKDHGLTVADIDHTSVFARTTDDLRAGGRQRAQPFLGRLVRAVLVPHGRKDTQFGERGFAVQNAQDFCVLIIVQAMCGNDVFGDLRFGHTGSPRRVIARLLGQSPHGGKGPPVPKRTFLWGWCGFRSAARVCIDFLIPSRAQKKGRDKARPKSNREVKKRHNRCLRAAFMGRVKTNQGKKCRRCTWPLCL